MPRGSLAALGCLVSTAVSLALLSRRVGAAAAASAATTLADDSRVQRLVSNWEPELYAELGSSVPRWLPDYKTTCVQGSGNAVRCVPAVFQIGNWQSNVKGLAALVGWLRTVSCAFASSAFFVVGIVMFLLPPVPGLAVYLCAGVVVPPACEPEIGFLGSCLHAAILAFVMKLVAQVMQQKGIGGS